MTKWGSKNLEQINAEAINVQCEEINKREKLVFSVTRPLPSTSANFIGIWKILGYVVFTFMIVKGIVLLFKN